MKTHKTILVAILIFAIGCSLIACSKKVKLETSADAIAYLENYIEENDQWKHIASKVASSTYMKNYYSKSNCEFLSSSTAKKDGDDWIVVLHGSIKGCCTFSYIASVTTDGQVSEIATREGIVTNFSRE